MLPRSRNQNLGTWKFTSTYDCRGSSLTPSAPHSLFCPFSCPMFCWPCHPTGCISQPASLPATPVALHLQALLPSLDDFQHLPATAYEVRLAWLSTSSSGPHPSLVQIMRPCHNIWKAGAGKKAQLCWHESIQAHTQFGKKWMWPWEEGWGSWQLSCERPGCVHLISGHRKRIVNTSWAWQVWEGQRAQSGRSDRVQDGRDMGRGEMGGWEELNSQSLGLPRHKAGRD